MREGFCEGIEELFRLLGPLNLDEAAILKFPACLFANREEQASIVSFDKYIFIYILEQL